MEPRGSFPWDVETQRSTPAFYRSTLSFPRNLLNIRLKGSAAAECVTDFKSIVGTATRSVIRIQGRSLVPEELNNAYGRSHLGTVNGTETIQPWLHGPPRQTVEGNAWDFIKPSCSNDNRPEKEHAVVKVSLTLFNASVSLYGKIQIDDISLLYSQQRYVSEICFINALSY